MKRLALLTSLLLVLGGGGASSEIAREARRLPGATLAQAVAVEPCEPGGEVYEIREADPAVDKDHHRLMRDKFIEKVNQPNTTVLLGPNVVLDFSELPTLAIPIGRCVTIKGVARFAPRRVGAALSSGLTFERATPGPARAPAGAVFRSAPAAAAATGAVGERPTEAAGDPPPPQPIPEARSSTALGPVLKFGPHRGPKDQSFFEITCYPGNTGQADHIRISGFRIFGPSMGQQDVGDRGILISKCVDIEISNMEIAGFGGEGIRIIDDHEKYFDPYPLQVNVTEEPAAYQLRGRPDICHEPPFTGPNGRIGRPEDVRVIGNFIHNNQQPRSVTDNHTGGYGVSVTDGAFALISQNLFSANRHAIEGGGAMGGYVASQNLVLRYGGIHFDTVFTVHTHEFDIHGTGKNGFGGWAGARTTYAENAFQYDNGNAIHVRGSPRCGITIRDNVFPHHGLEDDWGEDAVALRFREDLSVIRLGPNNKLDTQTYGQYGVCDFDGDGIDDLFLATGVSWWFSGMGEFPWRFMALRNERLSQVRFGYFDADKKCDVLANSGDHWEISSGGTGQWYRLSQAHAPLDQVAFGRFDPNVRDHLAGATRRTTHAFWRTPSGQWKIAALTGPDQGWHDAQSSGYPMSALRFGDFNGDGVTDVLAVEGGHWAISSGARSGWTRINTSLGDDVGGLYIADVDNNNIDDLIRLRARAIPAGPGTINEFYDWEISYDGSGPWKPLKSYRWTAPASGLSSRAFAGRFGTAPGAGVLTVDRSGLGQFYAPLETRVGAKPDWNSTFRY